MEREEEIRLIAYRLWEEEGCREGRALDYWLKAEAVWRRGQRDELRPVPPAQPAKSPQKKGRGKTTPPKAQAK